MIILSGTHGTEMGYNWDGYTRLNGLLHEKFYHEDMSDYANLIGFDASMPAVIAKDTAKMTIDDYKFFYASPDYHVIGGYCFSRNDRALLEYLDLPLVTPYLDDFYDEIKFGHIDFISL